MGYIVEWLELKDALPRIAEVIGKRQEHVQVEVSLMDGGSTKHIETVCIYPEIVEAAAPEWTRYRLRERWDDCGWVQGHFTSEHVSLHRFKQGTHAGDARLPVDVYKALFSFDGTMTRSINAPLKLRTSTIEARREGDIYQVKRPGEPWPHILMAIPAATFEALFEPVPEITARISDEVPGRIEYSIPLEVDTTELRKVIQQGAAQEGVENVDTPEKMAELMGGTAEMFRELYERHIVSTPVDGADWILVETMADLPPAEDFMADYRRILARALVELRESIRDNDAWCESAIGDFQERLASLERNSVQVGDRLTLVTSNGYECVMTVREVER